MRNFTVISSIFDCHHVNSFRMIEIQSFLLGKELSCLYPLVLNKRPPPRLLIFGKFLFQQLQNIQSILSVKAILTNVSVPELY